MSSKARRADERPRSAQEQHRTGGKRLDLDERTRKTSKTRQDTKSPTATPASPLDPVHEKINAVLEMFNTNASVEALPPIKEEQLVRDFIHDALYDPKEGYFIKHANIFISDSPNVGGPSGGDMYAPPTTSKSKGKATSSIMADDNGIPFDTLADRVEYQNVLETMYAKSSSDARFYQLWHTPIEAFKVHDTRPPSSLSLTLFCFNSHGTESLWHNTFSAPIPDIQQTIRPHPWLSMRWAPEMAPCPLPYSITFVNITQIITRAPNITYATLVHILLPFSAKPCKMQGM